MFGIAFLTDDMLSMHLVKGQAGQIAVILAIFAGYAMAITRRFELQGSVLALVSVVAFCVLFMKDARTLMQPLAFLAVALPALVHLAALGIHRAAVADRPAGSRGTSQQVGPC
jgi:hypothetical protein